MKTAIVLAFERLPLRLPGCFGGDVATPNFDRLAVDSIVFDQHFAENVDENAAGHAWWTGRYQFPVTGDRHSTQQAGWHELLSAAEVEVVAIAERTSSAALACPFPACAFVDASPGCNRLLQAVDQRLGELGREPPRDRLVWIQSAGISLPETEPSAMYSRAAEEMALLDASLATLRDAVDAFQQSARGELLFVFTAAQGAALGEQDQLPEQFQMPEELRRLSDPVVRTPMMLRLPGKRGTRRRELVQTLDLAPTLVDWFGVSADGLDFAGMSLLPLVDASAVPQVIAPREFLYYGDGRRAFGVRNQDFALLATSEALLTEGEPPDGEGHRLFVKPDDVWDVHNVADQEPEVVETLSEELREFLRSASSG